MPPPREYETEAVVIRKMNLGEADRLLTIFTPSFGKIRAVAKGARRPGSKLGGNLELLTHSHLLLAHGRNLDIITQSQTLNGFLTLKTDLDRTSWALYAAELVGRFTPDRMANRPVYDLLLETLTRLSQVPAGDGEMVLRYFELHMLHTAGYRPELFQCPACSITLPAAGRLSLSPAVGGLLCSRCSGQPEAYSISADAVGVLRMLQGGDYDSALKVKLGQGLTTELGKAMQEYISYVLEGRVKSVAWLYRLKAMREHGGPPPIYK